MNERPIFVDASAWIARFKPNDTHHERAQQIFQEEMTGNIPIITSNLVIYEVLTVLSMRAGKEYATEFGDWFFDQAVARKAVQYNLVNEVIEKKTWDLFRSHRKKNVSFTDYSSVVISQDWDVQQIFTFDQDFKSFGLKLLK